MTNKEYFLIGLEEGQNDLEDCLESDHDEEDECDEKRRKVSKVGLLYCIEILWYLSNNLNG